MKRRWEAKSTNGRNKNHHAYPWQYSRTYAVVIFDLQLGRVGKGPNSFRVNSTGSYTYKPTVT